MSPNSRMGKFGLCVFVAALFSLTSSSAQNWIQLAPAGTPPPSVGPGAFDTVDDQMIVFGGDIFTIWVLSNANGLGRTPQWSHFATLADPAHGFPQSGGPSAV